jgi:SAM-dependent methyltransferase
LNDNISQSSDEFAKEYRALRIKEGWALADGQEGPTSGNPSMWRGRVKSVIRAAAHLSKLKTSERRLVILDVGSGGGWASHFLAGAEVISIDLIPQPMGKLTIRADMRRLPLLDGSIDGALFAASLHYAEPSDVIPEAARVVRRGGLLVAVDSPIYPDVRSRVAATIRSRSYYLKAGFPRLAERYKPLEANELRRAITESGFRIEHWKVDLGISRAFRRLTGQPPGSLLVARRI